MRQHVVPQPMAVGRAAHRRMCHCACATKFRALFPFTDDILSYLSHFVLNVLAEEGRRFGEIGIEIQGGIPRHQLIQFSEALEEERS